MKKFELQQQRAAVLEKARSVVQSALTANRALSDEETRSVEGWKSEAEQISRKIELFDMLDSVSEDRSGRVGPGGSQELPDLENYSILRAMRMSLAVREGKTGARFDGLEAEVHQELSRTKPEGSEIRGVLVPWALASHRQQFGAFRTERRGDVTTTTAAGGIANILGTDLIQLLRNRMVMNAMGCNVLTGLVGGSFALPKQTGGETAYHVSEGGTPTSSNLTLGQVVWTPRTIAARSKITRKTLLQSSPDVEALVRKSIVMQVGREFDRVGVNGSGAGSVPLGLMQDPNVAVVAIGTNGGAPDWPTLTNLEKVVAQANADFGSMGYITSNAGRAKLKQTTKIASSQYASFLWEKGDTNEPGVGEVNGYRAMASEQIPSNLTKGSSSGILTAIIFGNFESATYGLWSGIDLLVDPYTAGGEGAIIINAYQDYDFQCLYETGFSKCVDVNPS